MTTLLSPRSFDLAIQEMSEKSRKRIYQTDFEAWLADTLNERMYAKMAEISHDVLFGRHPRTLVKSANGTGKDLALDTPILTTEGWSTMGALREGQYVFDECGKPTRITLKSEIMRNPCYRITFDDGSSFIAGEGHLWNTLTLGARSRVKGVKDWRTCWDAAETLETRDIATSMGVRARNHLIPLAGPLDYPEVDLPMSPYVLGAWLGDGSTARAEITCDYATDGYVVDQIRSAGYPLRYDGTEARPYRFMAECGTRGATGGKTSQMRLDLQAAGVLGNKHIPQDYLRASIEQRIELVRGLMDTDGWADSRGSLAGFGQSREQLVRNFEELLTGLGVRYSTSTKIPRGGERTWTVAFRAWFDPFTPGQRKSRVYLDSPSKQASRLTGRTIVSVEPTPTVPTACISVDGERSLYLAGRSLVPTHNTHSAARWALWWITAWPKEESLAIITAPTLKQVELGVFAYLKETYTHVKQSALADGRPMPWPGWISEQGEWRYSTPGGNQTLAVARVPGASDAVSTFQGLRKTGGRNFITLDEAGGVPEPIYAAIDALMTSGEARMGGIGNPDKRGNEFYNKFNTDAGRDTYQLHTISAYDLPTVTGEIVYPDDPAKQEMLLRGLTSRQWIAYMETAMQSGGETYYDEGWGEMRRSGGVPNGRFKSKVLGEFPGDADNTFFSEDHINSAREKEIPYEPETPVVLGCDIATTGEDESVVYVNRGGHLRLFGDTILYQDGAATRETTGVWSKEDTLTAARRIHAIANHTGATEVRIDGNAVGSGVATDLMRGTEFADRAYSVIRVIGSKSSSDIARWRIWRDEIHDHFADLMRDGLLDLDPDDNLLRDELMLITYKLVSGAIKIDPKAKMKTMMGGSPDRADAAMYAALKVVIEDKGEAEGKAVPARDVGRELTRERRSRRPMPV